MTEETTNTGAPDESTQPAAPVSTTGDGERVYSQSEVDKKMNNFIRQINEFKEREEAREAEAKKAEEQKALKRGELEKVIQSKEEAIAELQNKLQAQQVEAEKSQLQAQLKENGVTDPMALIGWTTMYFQQEERGDMREWIAKQKEAAPDSFKPAPTVVGTGAVGSVKKSGSTDSLEARLNSEDKQVRKAAILERAKKIYDGEIEAPR